MHDNLFLKGVTRSEMCCLSCTKSLEKSAEFHIVDGHIPIFCTCQEIADGVKEPWKCSHCNRPEMTGCPACKFRFLTICRD